jgi:hypothetical protein
MKIDNRNKEIRGIFKHECILSSMLCVQYCVKQEGMKIIGYIHVSFTFIPHSLKSAHFSC